MSKSTTLSPEEKRQKYLDYHKEYYVKHAERLKEASKRWRENNKERADAGSRNWRESNKERRKNSDRKWADANRLKLKSYRFKSLYGIDMVDYDQMLKNQGGVCCLCLLPAK